MNITNYGQWVIRWRWLIIIASLAITAFVGSGAKNLAFVVQTRMLRQILRGVYTESSK